jgi:predicted O-methyltransferase YrrM
LNPRALRLGLATVLGLARRGFFIPYRYADALPRGGEVPAYVAIRRTFDGRRHLFRRLLRRIDSRAAALESIGGPPPGPRWTQDWFPRLDAAVLYTIVRDRRPRRIVEVGSGHSTRFMARAVTDGGLDCRITAIDPAPRAGLANLPVDWRRETVQQTPLEVFAGLGPNDILFVDSSHILMPGSDVDHIVNRILPILPEGVIVHFHDVFLPEDYPVSWAWRNYNEQNAIAPLLQCGYQVLFPSRYVATTLASDLAGTVVARLPLPDGALESSLWLVKRRSAG